MCDGLDNDCDGVVDDAPASHTCEQSNALHTCIDGACACAPQNLCGSTCSNLTTDSQNCGTCGHACGTGETCAASNCCCELGTTCPQGSSCCSGLSLDSAGACAEPLEGPCTSDAQCAAGICGANNDSDSSSSTVVCCAETESSCQKADDCCNPGTSFGEGDMDCQSGVCCFGSGYVFQSEAACTQGTTAPCCSGSPGLDPQGFCTCN